MFSSLWRYASGAQAAETDLFVMLRHDQYKLNPITAQLPFCRSFLKDIRNLIQSSTNPELLYDSEILDLSEWERSRQGRVPASNLKQRCVRTKSATTFLKVWERWTMPRFKNRICSAVLWRAISIDFRSTAQTADPRRTYRSIMAIPFNSRSCWRPTDTRSLLDEVDEDGYYSNGRCLGRATN